MDQHFRFSLYLRRLGRQWKLILIPTVIALLVAVLVSFLQPVRYTASATMIAPNPQLIWRWTNKVTDRVDFRFDWRAEVMPLVKTEKVASLALEQVDGELSQTYTPQEVIGATSVQPGAGSLFIISVESSDPNDAALLANALADALSTVVDDVYAGNQDAFDDALDEVKTSFEEWDEKWRAFRAQYGIDLGFTGNIAGIGDEKLYGHQSAIMQELTILSSEVGNLKAFEDEIALVLTALDQDQPDIHLAVLDSPYLSNYGLVFDDLHELSPQELKDALSSLQALVQSDVEAMNTKLLALQDEVARLRQENDNIVRNRSVWRESVSSLENKQIEFDVKRIVEGQRLQQVDSAKPPARPSQPNWPQNLALALAVGLLGGLFLAVLAVYLGGEDNSKT